MRATLAGLLAALALAALPSVSEAQRPPRFPGGQPGGQPLPTRQQTPPRARGDTTRARPDSARADTARELVKWAEEDSVMKALLEREGYTVTRYQSDRVTFDAANRAIHLNNDPRPPVDSAKRDTTQPPPARSEGKSVVGRGETILVGDSIIYNDSTKYVFARGDTVVLRDPQQSSADVVVQGLVEYDITNRRARVQRVATAVESGDRWFVRADRAAFIQDTSAAKNSRFYGRAGALTTCDEPIPDYHFAAREMKVISGNVLVARPAVLYIKDIPIMWLPFIFQDMRKGRRSGLLTPRFGISELLRNSPTYRRHIDNFGYYFNLGDYMDAQVSLDWRSGARPSEGDPGWIRYNGEWQYRWLDRFLSGRMAAYHLRQRDGSSTSALSWSHNQEFGQQSRLSTDINYATSTQVVRQTTINPYQALATIRSNANYTNQFGPVSLNVGGSQTQYPGREQVDRNFPTLSLTSKPVNLTSWLLWTPSFNTSTSQSLKIDQAGFSAFRYFTTAAGAVDSARANRSTRNSSMSIETPFKVFEFNVPLSIRFNDQLNDFPTTYQSYFENADSNQRSTRVFKRTFKSSLDWNTAIQLPAFFQGRWNLSPTIGIANVDPEAFLVRTERTGGRWIAQSKRLNYGVSASPTFFGLFPGFGPVSRFRHTVQPSLSYTYSPAAKVSDEFLAALGRTRQGYLGSLTQSALTLQMNTNIEAKMRAGGDTVAEDDANARKVKLLSVNFSSLSYDFIRADTAGNGFVTPNFNFTLQSDLLPGFDFGMDYSLFRGDPTTSDTAEFAPYRTNIRAAFSLNRQSSLIALFSRIFGRAVPAQDPRIESAEPRAGDEMARQVASQPIAGQSSRNAQFAVPSGQGFQASFTFTASRQRPVRAGDNVTFLDPTAECEPFREVNPIAYANCVSTKSTSPGTALPFQPTTVGGTVFRSPPQTSVQSSMSFDVTPKWSAQWSTTYDFVEKDFASHIVSLQRELHDWRAIFAFTQAPSGSFAFNFFISLNAQPDLKFDYNKQSYRAQ